MSQNGSYLAHTGDKGMRWGIRRWRNYDGSLTEEGKERYNYYSKKGKGVGRAVEKAYYDRYDNRGGESQATKDIKSVKSAVSDAQSGLDKLNFGVTKKSLAGKTDEELRKAINRAKLEDDYSKYYPTTVKSDTRKKLDKFLAVAGVALGVGVTASQIYSTIVTAQAKRNEAYDKSVDDSELKKKVEAVLSGVKNMSASDVVNMDSSTYDAVRDAIKQRAGTWQNIKTLQG